MAAILSLLSIFACADDGDEDDGANDSAETVGDGDGDPGDGDPGDGDPGDGDPGDGDPGDGDPGDGDPGDGDGDPGDGDGEPGDGDGEPGDGDGDGEPIMCPGVFPTFDKSCGSDEQCVIAIHTTDCCGNSVALGINEAELADFQAAEAICDSQYPPCGCPAGPTMAEDGQAVENPRKLVVGCVDGSCMTSVQ